MSVLHFFRRRAPCEAQDADRAITRSAGKVFVSFSAVTHFKLFFELGHKPDVYNASDHRSRR